MLPVISIFLNLWASAHYKLFSWSRASRETTKSIGAELDLDFRAAEKLHGFEERAAWLRGQLRKTPYWTAGHASLAEVSLEIDDVGTAYASTHAALTLTPTGPRAVRAKHLLGICYLRKHAFQEAAKVFDELLAISPSNRSLREDRAASAMGLNDYAKTVELLQTMNEKDLSPEAAAALHFCRKKAAGETK